MNVLARRPRARIVVALVVLALVASACQRPERQPNLGVSRIALNLAFSADELVEPVPPEIITQLVPAPPEVREPEDLFDFASPPASTPRPPTFSFCPKAEPGAAPSEPTVFQVKRPPDHGAYGRSNSGKIVVSGGVIPITLPYPPLSAWHVIHTPDQVTAGISGVTSETRRRTWQVRRIIAPGFESLDHMRIDGNNVQLVRRDTTVNRVTTSFVPSPPINVYVAGNEGDTWTSAGVDSASGTAMVVSARIEAREVVDACGTPVDTYRVTSDEQFVNLETGDTSGTNAGDPNVYHVATQYGALFVREDVHTFSTTQTESGAPLTVELDYISTLRGIKAEPIK